MLAAARLAVLVLVLTGISVSSAIAAPPTPENPAGHDILGVVRPHAAGKGGGGNNLTYHGGPIVQGDQTYAIYWDPPGYTMSDTYQHYINQFLGDVAAANTANYQFDTYFSDTQYTNSAGQHVSFNGSAFNGGILDTQPFPADGCKDSVAATTACLSDGQLTTELNRLISASNGALPQTSNTIYFIFTPQNVGSCYSSSSCAFSSYCAYHSDTATSAGHVLYANQPYTATVPSACGSGQSPNGDSAADSTINVTSHEHNEAITDPFGTAWFDSRGYENADKCAWTFGTASGPSGAQYNQTINNHHYYLQRNWSNQRSSCVLTGL